MWSEAAPQSEAQQSSSPESVIFILINLYFLKNSPVKIKRKTTNKKNLFYEWILDKTWHGVIEKKQVTIK